MVKTESVHVQTESDIPGEVILETSPYVSIYFSHPLHDVCVAGETLFEINEKSCFLDWEEYGLKITIPQGTVSSTETCKIAVIALVGGHFQFPEGTELISAVYAISVSKPLLKPVKLEIQHCAVLLSQEHTTYLSFATASTKQSTLPYIFQLQEGGHFDPNEQYGSIHLSHFCQEALVKSTSKPMQSSSVQCSTSELIPSTPEATDFVTNTIESVDVIDHNRSPHNAASHSDVSKSEQSIELNDESCADAGKAIIK